MADGISIMKEFKKFTLYKPENNPLAHYVLFLKSDKNIDWYEAQKQFSLETIKLVYEDSGRICSAGKDASGLWPINCSVVEMAENKIPDTFTADGNWQYKNGKVLELLVDPRAKANVQKTLLLENATAVIAPLEDAIDLEMATPEERARLKEWKKYRVLLSRTDTSSAPDIDWPLKPKEGR